MGVGREGRTLFEISLRHFFPMEGPCGDLERLKKLKVRRKMWGVPRQSSVRWQFHRKLAVLGLDDKQPGQSSRTDLQSDTFRAQTFVTCDKMTFRTIQSSPFCSAVIVLNGNLSLCSCDFY